MEEQSLVVFSLISHWPKSSKNLPHLWNINCKYSFLYHLIWVSLVSSSLCVNESLLGCGCGGFIFNGIEIS